MTVTELIYRLRQIKRRSQPRVAIEIDVFRPDDRRAVIVRMGR